MAVALCVEVAHAARPRATSAEITEIVGPPDFISGCSVTGDLAGLAAGRPVDLRLRARVTISYAADLSSRTGGNVAGSRFKPSRQVNPTVLVIDNFPPASGPSVVARAIVGRTSEPRWA